VVSMVDTVAALLGDPEDVLAGHEVPAQGRVARAVGVAVADPSGV
jgi:hypothetical protein